MTRHRSSFRLRITTSILLVCSAMLSSVAAAQDEDPATKRAQLEQQKKALTGEIDALKANNEQLVGVLSDINSQLISQQAAVDQAAKQVADASARVQEAQGHEQTARDQLAATEQRLRQLAVSAYVGPPGEIASVVLLGGPIDEMPKRRVLAGVRLEQVSDAVAELKKVRSEAARLRAQLQEAEAAARQAEVEQKARLQQLTDSQNQHQALLDQVATRLDRALAERDQISAEDAALAAQIKTHEDELNRKLLVASTPPAAPPSPASGARGDAGDSSPKTAPPPAAAPAPSSPSGSSGAPPATSPPSSPPSPPPSSTPNRVAQITPVDTTWVGGIEVATSIAGQLANLLAAARADGLALTGSGYRNIYDQIAIRQQYCGTTDYDIWDRPSWECSPPVARPGRSMHEKGLAIDFTGPNGDLVRTHDSPTYKWLAANAARFGLYNLPSEPWHWSVNGN